MGLTPLLFASMAGPGFPHPGLDLRRYDNLDILLAVQRPQAGQKACLKAAQTQVRLYQLSGFRSAVWRAKVLLSTGSSTNEVVDGVGLE